MEEQKEYRFQCKRCGNCCTDKNTLVNVTYHDLIRIIEGLDLNIDETLEILGFYIFDKPPSKDELEKMVVPPIETERGPAFTGIKKDMNGKCYFYDEKNKKCLIYKLRPMFCRTFPFSFRIEQDNRDRKNAKIKMFYTDKGKKFCKGINSEAPCVDMERMTQLGKKTINQLNENNVLIDKWNEAVRKGKIEPTAKNFLLTIYDLMEKKSNG
jgi:Fe-S-cluster containining protein